ncbi:hypothetical protein [Legionella waltersii]|uniref:Tetratricopeptide repeat protein n=1 Tax=Legionella waltersii TaxID=66969 RepID=A0A0W1A516_9GAMM|nr:hypothetical protein [Legionella waltersii]KTD76304.1 hypothetical protein Lwal_2026 [Legionella waltersii]SNV13574.1 Uncharacterised protein [Legionella waltersii]
MPIILKVSEDNAIQFSPSQATYYELNPRFNNAFPVPKTAYTTSETDPNEEVLLKSKGIHHCHTVIVRDKKYNNYFILHVSPQALRRPYDSVTKIAGTATSLFGYGMFSMDFDTSMTNSKKPAYIDLDPYYYDNAAIGTHIDSELEVIVVVNDEHWSKELAEMEILATFKARVPGNVVKSNIIVNKALEHAYYYSVQFDPKSENVTIHSNNGIYSESYDHAFENNVNRYAHDVLPLEKQMALRNALSDLISQAQVELETIFARLKPYDALEQLVLNPSKELQLTPSKKVKLETLINAIEALIMESKNPVLNLGSPNLYKCYKKLGLLYLLTESYEKSAFYLSKAADYAVNMKKAEFHDDLKFYSILAGAVYERDGCPEKAYYYYNEASAFYSGVLDEFDENLSRARIASQIPGKEIEALNALFKAKSVLPSLMKRAEELPSPQKDEILQALDLRHTACGHLLDSLKECLIEHRHESAEFQQEYDKLFGLAASLTR